MDIALLPILNTLVDAIIAAMVFYAFRKHNDKIFFYAWALYGFMNIYWTLPIIVLYQFYSVPFYFRYKIDGKLILAISAYFTFLIGSMIIVVSYFLYRKHRWAYLIAKIFCYLKAFELFIIYPLGYALMIYMFFAGNIIFPYNDQLLVVCNTIIGICFLIYFFKCLDMNKPNLNKKKKRRLHRIYFREDIKCPECGNMISSLDDCCEKCSWSYNLPKNNNKPVAGTTI